MSNEPLTGQVSSAQGEYRKRLWMGLIMALLAAGAIVADGHLAGWLGGRFYPCLFVSLVLLSGLCCLELHALLPEPTRPPLWLALVGTIALLLAGWPGWLGWLPDRPWNWIAWTFAGLVLASFLYEMAVYTQPGNIVVRSALFVWMLAYLGLLPAFLLQLRFWPGPEGSPDEARGAAALALVIFVPKCCDIAAYFTCRRLGRHKMTPLLSPKKTWEGLAGGLVVAGLTALLLGWLWVPLFGGPVEAVLFGLVVGLAGVLGDLAESLIKRDCGAKDASRIVPGFGGFLDVADSVLFAAPVAYWWFRGV